MRKLSVDFWGVETGKSIRLIRPFMGLPSISSLKINGLHEELFSPTSVWKNLLLNSTAKELSLISSMISCDTLAPFLSSFTSLERFYYSYSDFVSEETAFQPLCMMRALDHLKPCLKVLTILTDYMISYSDPIGSFSDFQVLTCIRTSASVMIGDVSSCTSTGTNQSQSLIDVVPPTLQLLSLRHCSENAVSNIFELVSEKRSRTPHLRYLDLDWRILKYPDKPSPVSPTLHPGFAKDEADRLIMECNEAGIALILHDMSPPVKTVEFATYLAPAKLEQLGQGRNDQERNNQERNDYRENSQRWTTRHFLYPYNEYEGYCKEHGCDPATGKPPGVGKFVITHVDLYPAEVFE